MGARPVEDRERLTLARPGLLVAAARVKEEHGRGFPRERGEESGDEHGGRARRARARERETERGGRGEGERERERVRGGRERDAGGGGSVSDDGGGREEAVSMARATTR